MKNKMKGRVIRLAFNDVNTDIIAPGEYRLQVADNDHQLTALRPHVFRAIRPGLDAFVKPGDIFVVGKTSAQDLTASRPFRFSTSGVSRRSSRNRPRVSGSAMRLPPDCQSSNFRRPLNTLRRAMKPRSIP